MIWQKALLRNNGTANNESLYLQMAPNGKYVILVGGSSWKLINPATGEAVLTFNPNKVQIRFVFQKPVELDLFFSPDGNKLYIPAGGKVTVIDLQEGKKLKNIGTKAKDAMVCW
jgi:DNA-binding beta-propeller fold protein YncE